MLKKLLAVAVLSLTIVGCASVPMGDSGKNSELKKFTPKEDVAGIYVYRNETFGAALKMNVFVDGKLLGQTAAHTYLYTEVPPGSHAISSKEGAQLIKIRLEATRKQDKALYFNEKMQPNNNEQYYESHWFNITDGKSRFVAGYSKNITAQKKKSLEIQKLASRLSYISMNTSECVWEWELENNKLHINKKLNSISGYYTETKYRGIKFWVQQVVYKEDRIGILRKLNRCISSGSACLKLQYRVVAKTGETRWLCDTIHFVYRFGKPYRVLGSLKDKTDMVALENEVKLSESEKTKAVNAAGIKAQEEVRDSISKELHDNINQLILSSKLYISIARNQPEIADEMLDKAIEYQFAALEEGRKLSKQLSVAAIHHHGFSITVNEIVSHLTINKIK